MITNDSADLSVNGSSGNGAVNANATSGVTAELKNEIQKIVMGIFKDQVPRAVKSAVSESIPEALKAVMGDLQPGKANEPASQAAQAGNAADPEKVTQKARIEALEKQLQAFQKRAEDSESRARDASMRSRVQSEVAKFLPANDPNHAAYMGMLYDIQKRFVDADGNPSVKFKREWGEENVPLEQGVKELFEGELKHLVQHSKAQNLPSAGFRGVGKPIPGMQVAKGQPQLNPLDRDLIEAVAKDRPELAEALATQALAAQQK